MNSEQPRLGYGRHSPVITAPYRSIHHAAQRGKKCKGSKTRVIQLLTFLRAFDLLLELILHSGTLTPSEVRRGRKQDTYDPPLSRIHSSGLVMTSPLRTPAKIQRRHHLAVARNAPALSKPCQPRLIAKT
jgi:hypothetical protein